MVIVVTHQTKSIMKCSSSYTFIESKNYEYSANDCFICSMEYLNHDLDAT